MALDSKRSQTTAFEVERFNQEFALVREELRIKDMRWSRIAPQRRPHYAPVERMAILIPFTRPKLQHELSLFRRWFNAYRPHMALGGKTPNEVYFCRKPANCKPRYEPRLQWPRGSACAHPQAPIKGRRGGRLTLHVNLSTGAATCQW